MPHFPPINVIALVGFGKSEPETLEVKQDPPVAVDMNSRGNIFIIPTLAHTAKLTVPIE